ncbi:DUF6562 domain-containing protein [Bacteroides fragilis]|uniref:DUF6562 domain-containing protein n=1 Tax=Bacteroides fragilis TaxID=817 RepID=UPI00189E8187|nr:DUF6562 domain-containing protein [Bacteroides fragilis]
MKKYTLYLLLAALTGLFASCSQDENPAQTSENNSVRIGASIDGALRTRAGTDFTIPDGYKLRYVLEVYSSANALVQKHEQTATDANSVNFDFKLADAGTYTAVVWADFVTDGTGTKVDAIDQLNEYTHYADKHYKTTDNLQQVGVITTGYVINDESRDAFCACKTITKEVGALTQSITLTRPFGQINVIEKKADLCEKVASMTLTYKVPASFNVKTGAVSNSAEVKPTVNTPLPTATTDRKANLFYDFILAPAAGQTTLEAIAMEFTSADNTVVLNDYTIPANMPVKRNKRTNISGSILHTSTAPSDAASLSVGISNGWEGTTEEVEVPRVGDFFYQDGTFSPIQVSDKTLVGKIFWINPNDRMKGKITSVDFGSMTWTKAQSWESANTLPDGMSWRVPTKEELQHLYCAYNGVEPTTWETNASIIANEEAKSAFTDGLQGFGNYIYWSSEEENTEEAWTMTFTNGGNTITVKKSTDIIRVRCVSDF